MTNVSKRLRKADTTPEEWQAHRKLRKKIASAKWYAKKKKREIQEENQLRQKLEEEYQATKPVYLWTPLQRAYWRCALDHHVRGYPIRPDSVEPVMWCRWVDEVEAQIQRTRVELQDVPWARHVPWDDDLGVLRVLRQLGLREVRSDTPSESRWMTGPLGVVLAGCVRQWGLAKAIEYWPPIQNAIRQTIDVHTTQRHPPSTHAIQYPTPNPNKNDAHDHIDHDWERWIEHTLFPAPCSDTTMSSSASWWDSDEEEAFMAREWPVPPSSPEKDEEDDNQPFVRDTDNNDTNDSSSSSLPSSLDPLVDEWFPLTTHKKVEHDGDTSSGLGTEDSTSQPNIIHPPIA